MVLSGIFSDGDETPGDLAADDGLPETRRMVVFEGKRQGGAGVLTMKAR